VADNRIIPSPRFHGAVSKPAFRRHHHGSDWRIAGKVYFTFQPRSKQLSPSALCREQVACIRDVQGKILRNSSAEGEYERTLSGPSLTVMVVPGEIEFCRGGRDLPRDNFQ
jgi:hypothetical protein